LPEKQSTPRGPKWDIPGRHSKDFSTHKLGKIAAGGEDKKKYPARECEVCAAHKKQCETTYICKFYVVLLHRGSCFEIYHLIRYCQTLNMQFQQYWVQTYRVYTV
jgi:hypothetical protein